MGGTLDKQDFNIISSLMEYHGNRSARTITVREIKTPLSTRQPSGNPVERPAVQFCCSVHETHFLLLYYTLSSPYR